jgi:hypothetical protein
MFSNTRASAGEQQPLVQSVAPASMGKACFLAVVGSLMCAWCILDSWQREASMQLFGLSKIENPHINASGDMTGDVSRAFTYPLTLAFFQFAFMSVIFFAVWWLLTRNAEKDIAGVHQNLFSSQWTGLVATHVFSTFWLQSLMMPMQLMSPVVFAASRAVQVPAAAGFRSKIIGGRFGGHPLHTTAMMFGAATLIIYSQSMIAECLCIWSGHAVELAGISLFIIYMLVLILPAANTVCMESVIVNLETNPLLMLAVMNALACFCCAPIMVFAHIAGWENISAAVAATAGSRELCMLVLWLGIQMVLFAAVSLALIAVVDSFWAVALTTSFKAVFWWCSHVLHMYVSCPLTNVSVQHPHASLWGFIMLLGCMLVGIAAVTDAKAPKDPYSDKTSQVSGEGPLQSSTAEKV